MAALEMSGSTSVETPLSDKEDSSMDEEEEETEPKLQYQRLGNDVGKILKKDAASCLAVHSKVLALGTHSGIVYILDHLGNSIRTEHLHSTTINQISIDTNGDHIATCSDDAKVIILGLYNNEHNRVFRLEKPVLSVALDPIFHKPVSGRKFVVGDDKVTLYEKTYLSRFKETVLYPYLSHQQQGDGTKGGGDSKGEGLIRNISWNGRFVTWATDYCVRVFDIVSRQTIAKIKREFDASTIRPEEHRCNLFWKDSVTLLVGWADTVEVGVVRKKTPDPNRKNEFQYFMEIVSIFNCPSFVNGIAPMSEMVVTLTIPKNPEDQEEGTRPHLNVLEPVGVDDSVEFSKDILNVKKSQDYCCNDYHLESLPEEGLYFIVSPKDVIVAKPRNDDDHVAWLLEHKHYEAALEAVEASRSLRKHDLLSVGHSFLNHLLHERKYNDAGRLCARFLSKKAQWEEEVYKFAHIQQLTAIAPFLPMGDPALDPAIYEMVLNEFLQKNTQEFVDVIRRWPCNLYSIPVVASAVLDKLTIDPCNTLLLEGLSELYTYEKKYDKALDIYFKIGNKDRVFDLIRNHGLLGSVQDKLTLLMTLNKDEATNILLENIQKVPVNSVVDKLKDNPNLLYTYLSRLFQKDAEQGQEHHGLLVELYAEYEPSSLLRFLKSSNNYPLEKALDICQQRGLLQEAIFLLGRVGSTKQALQMIMEKLGDIEEAIRFCMDHDDQELWDDFIEYSLGEPEFIRELLKNIGTHVDPIVLIQKIPEGMVIPGLRGALVTILQDINLQMRLGEGCKKILVSDCFGLLEKLNKQQNRGFQVTDDQICQACNRRLLGKDIRGNNDIRIFYCKHGFHENCLPTLGMDTCSSCSAQKRRPGTANAATFRQ